MKFDDMFPSKFLKASDFDKPLTLRIKTVELEKVGGDDGEIKPVCYFTNQDKPLILNKTNTASIVNITGSDDSDDWIGVKVELYSETILFRGERKPAVRMRKPRPLKTATAEPVSLEDAPDDDEVPDSWEDDIPPRKRAS